MSYPEVNRSSQYLHQTTYSNLFTVTKESKHIHQTTYSEKCTKKKFATNLHTKEFHSESCWSKPNLDYNYTFTIESAPYIIPFAAKSIGKVELQPKFGIIAQDLEGDFVCVCSTHRRIFSKSY